MKSTIHARINLKSEVLNSALRKGNQVPYSGKSKYNYAIDISPQGSVSAPGIDPEDTTFYRDFLCEFSTLLNH